MINVIIDTNLLVVLVWLYLIIEGLSSILVGSVGMEKETHYGVATILSGMIMLIIALIVVVW